MNETRHIHASSTVVATGDQLSTELGGEAVVLNLATGTYYGLNETGARVWSLLAVPTSVDAVCRQLEAEFEVDPETCETTVIELLDALARAGLVEVIDEAA
jgi:hypothetical protein